jgi:2,3-bisphosphoglycerate-independent phosphoglycerate mutase
VRRTHTEDPVPFLVFRTRAPRTDGAAVFDEQPAGASGLFLPRGLDLLPFCLGTDA